MVGPLQIRQKWYNIYVCTIEGVIRMNLMFWKRRKTISQLSQEIQTPFKELKKRTRIAVIDDDTNSIPVDALREDGFSIDTFTQIDVPLLNRLKNGDFDIIILDIKGVVAPQIIKNDGLGVLQYLKEHNPMQIIIACSSNKFDPTKCMFFNLANNVLDKPITFVECQEKLEQIITENMSLESRWYALSKYLQTIPVPDQEIHDIEKQLINKLQGKNISLEKILQHFDTHAPAYTLGLQALRLIFRLHQ